MPYLIDTNVLAEVRKQPHRDPGVSAWIASVTPDELFVSVLSLGEIRRGIELCRRRNPTLAGQIEKWLEGLETHYADRILPVSGAVADRWGRLSPSQPLSTVDGLLAATAIEHKLTVVTRNTQDFVRSGADLLNPFVST